MLLSKIQSLMSALITDDRFFETKTIDVVAVTVFDRGRYRIKCAAHNIHDAEDYREGVVVARIIPVSNRNFILLSSQTKLGLSQELGSILAHG